MRRILIYSATMLLLSSFPAYAGSVGGMGGALETTQWLNKAILEGVRESGLQEVFNTSQIVSKQIQQYATQIQELQQAVLGNLSIPFAIVNDFKNSFNSLYGTVKGSGEALYSYTNADKWMSDMKSRSGYLTQSEYLEKSAIATAQAQQDIITKEESDFATAEQIQQKSNSAQGTTGAVQANTQAALLNNATLKDQNLLLYEQFQYVRNRDELARVSRDQDREAFLQHLQKTSTHKW